VTERVVYSTERGRLCPRCGWPASDCRCSETLSAGREPVPAVVTAKLRLEKRASGKSVTVVDGLPDNAAYVEALAKAWKKACGTGGSTVSGAVELQGDQRERLRELLGKAGMRVKG
jgi:translation initiation factor 1